MRTSTDHILTSHVGSLPRPDELIAANRAREEGKGIDPTIFEATLRRAVHDIVRHQKEIGIDVPGDGVVAPSMTHYRHADELTALLSPRVITAMEATGAVRGGFSDVFPADVAAGGNRALHAT